MRVLAALATLVAGAALACVAAYWGWQLLGPAAVRVPSSGPVNPAATITRANLFGNDGSPDAERHRRSGASGADTKLLGIITESGERGYALFRLPTVRKLVAQGARLRAARRSSSIQRDGVTIRDGAGERRYLLRSNAGGRRPRCGARWRAANVRTAAAFDACNAVR